MREDSVSANRRRVVSAGVASISAAVIPAARAISLQPLQIDAVTLNGPFFNVKDYGAKGDAYPGNASPTDDTCAINLAITAAVNSYVGAPAGTFKPGGGVVLLPAGRYYVAGTLWISRTNFTTPCLSAPPCNTCDPTHQGVTLLGAGPNATTLVVPDNYAGASISISPGGVADLQFCNVENLAIESINQRTVGTAIAVVAATGHSLKRVNMARQFVGCAIGTASGGCLDVTIEDGIWTSFSSGGTGLVVDGLTVDTHVRDLNISSNVTPPYFAGVRLRSASGWFFNQVEVSAAQYGLVVDSDSSRRVEFGFFTACGFDSCSVECIHIVPSTGTAHSITFANCWSSGAALNCCVIGGPTNGVEFVGHRFLDSGVHGLYVQQPAMNVHVNSSVASGQPNGAGYFFDTAANHFSVTNSHAGPYGGAGGLSWGGNKYGVYVASSCHDYIVSNNSLSGNTISGFINSGITPKIDTPNLT
jgi:hypothetical protein